MFSGIVEQVGKIIKISGNHPDVNFVIQSVFTNLNVGDSVSVNGACLTIRSIEQRNFVVTASNETLKLTNLGLLKENDYVNLETSLTLNKPIGGHVVQGHIATTTKIISLNQVGEAKYYKFAMPKNLEKYIVTKGYIAIDGMSLTIIDQQEDFFEIMFIPHTLEHTIAGSYKVGSIVNIEVDVIARYIEKFNAYK